MFLKNKLDAFGTFIQECYLGTGEMVIRNFNVTMYLWGQIDILYTDLSRDFETIEP